MSEQPVQQQPVFYPMPLAPPRPTSGLAVAGFICSLLWGFGLGSLVGVILCGIAWQRTKTGEKGGHGLAVAGVIIGALGLVGFALMMAITLAASSGYST